MTADFIPGSNVLQVVVRDPQPVRAVRLVAPDGTVTEAGSINTDRVYDGGSGSSLGLGLGGFGFGRGGGGGGGVGVGMPLGSPRVHSVATATIPLAAPTAYRSDWQHYHIDVLIGDPPQIVSLNAPEPR